MVASFLWADWLAVGSPTPSPRSLLWDWVYEWIWRCKLIESTEKTITPQKTHHETHIRPASATNSRRRVKKHVPRVSPYSPTSTDTGFVEVGLVQLSQSVKTTNVTHTLRYRQTDRLNKQWHPVRTPVWRGFFALEAKNGLGRFAFSALPHYEEAFHLKEKNRLGRFAPWALPQYNSIRKT